VGADRVPDVASAQEAAPVAVAPLGQFLRLESPIDDAGIAHVATVAQDLLAAARREAKPGLLVLEIPAGTSPLHQVQALARLLTSSPLAPLKTIAYVPETVTGPNALVALACQEIVMHPDAELGDLGRGQPVEPEDEQLMLALAQKRINPKVSTALVQAMLDPQVQLWRIRLQLGDPAAPRFETRAATRAEVDGLRETGAVIEQAEVIKEAGVLGTFRGSTARDLEILVSQVAESRTDVAKLYNLPREAMREQRREDQTPKVRLIKITGVIDSLQESYLVRQIDRARAAGAELLIFEIDSPGGELLASTDLAQTIADLEASKIRTVAYVPEQALSGAAIIALGCDEIYLRPEAQIGDAGPIEVRPGQPFERAPEKILSTLRATLKTLAERKGRPVALCEAMADASLKVFQGTDRKDGRIWYLSEAELAAAPDQWLPGPQVREANGELLLTVDGRRAHELLLAERPVADLDDLKARLNLPATLRLMPVDKTWVDAVVFILNNPFMVMFLFMVGIGSLYLELHFPSGMFGILSCVCFALFFWSKFLGGTAGWLEVILFLLGAGCLAIEIFMLPGFGVFGLSGILLLMASVVMASQSWGNFEPYADVRQMMYSLGTFAGAGIAVLALAVAFGRYLPHIPFMEGMILAPPNQSGNADEPRLAPGLLPESPATMGELVGVQGVAASLLRPAGKAELQGRMIDVVSDGPFIPAGSTIEVVSTSGNRTVVRRIG
jgi:membrane-bound serine protease (ClpP class)